MVQILLGNSKFLKAIPDLEGKKPFFGTATLDTSTQFFKENANIKSDLDSLVDPFEKLALEAVTEYLFEPTNYAEYQYWLMRREEIRRQRAIQAQAGFEMARARLQRENQAEQARTRPAEMRSRPGPSSINSPRTPYRTPESFNTPSVTSASIASPSKEDTVERQQIRRESRLFSDDGEEDFEMSLQKNIHAMNFDSPAQQTKGKATVREISKENEDMPLVNETESNKRPRQESEELIEEENIEIDLVIPESDGYDETERRWAKKISDFIWILPGITKEKIIVFLKKMIIRLETGERY